MICSITPEFLVQILLRQRKNYISKSKIAVNIALFPRDMRYVHGKGVCNTVHSVTVKHC